MVTAILPSMVPKDTSEPSQQNDLDVNSQGTIQKYRQPRHSRLAGFVGLFAGVGALLAVGAYLPIPTRLQRLGIAPRQALADTYYIAGATAIVVAIACYFGLRGEVDATPKLSENRAKASSFGQWMLHSVSTISTALRLTHSHPSLGLGILASFVARASSVCISLFIPLFVNSSLCNHPAHDVEDMKTHCRKAYVIAAQLSGVSQLFALVFAPIFGYFPFRYRRLNVPLMLATFAGMIGYGGFAKLNTSGTGPVVFFFVALLGISQIGAIVSSLSLVSSAVLDEQTSAGVTAMSGSDSMADPGETVLLLNKPPTVRTHEHLKGTIAGIYSFAGSLAILILTKLGGFLFDHLGSQAPFYLLALFNLILLLATFGCGALEWYSNWK